MQALAHAASRLDGSTPCPPNKGPKARTRCPCHAAESLRRPPGLPPAMPAHTSAPIRTAELSDGRPHGARYPEPPNRPPRSATPPSPGTRAASTRSKQRPRPRPIRQSWSSRSILWSAHRNARRAARWKRALQYKLRPQIGTTSIPANWPYALIIRSHLPRRNNWWKPL